jgi:hypothetical protein
MFPHFSHVHDVLLTFLFDFEPPFTANAQCRVVWRLLVCSFARIPMT